MADNAEVRINQGALFTLIAGEPATYDAAGYATLLAGGTVVGEIHDYGTYGGSRSVQTHTPVATGKIKKRGGSLDFGNLPLAFGRDLTDAGQTLLTSLFNSGEVCSAMITDDAGVEYFTGVITNNEVTRGDAETIITQAGTMDLSYYLVVPA